MWENRVVGPATSGRIHLFNNKPTGRSSILISTRLNKVHPIKRFGYHAVALITEGTSQRIVAEIRPRANSRPRCSGCGEVYRHFLARWASRLSWKETATCFHSSWDIVCRSVQWVVDYGLKHRDLEDITASGVDEVSHSKGHQYMTLVYQIDKRRKRLLGVIQDRKTESLSGFFEAFGPERCARIKVVCSDLWKPYLNVIAVMLPGAMRSKLGPMKKFVKTLRAHEDLLMNYFKAGKHYASGIVEGLNLRINLWLRKAYGCRSFELLQTSLFHTLGDLPEPEFTHRFC